MENPRPPIEELALKTIDGITLAGSYYNSEGSKGAVVFAHAMPATKESWESLAKKLADIGFVGLAIDLRGHGASDGGPKTYAKYSDEEHQKSILDIDAAVKFLMGKGFTAGQVSLVGASIGANLTLRYLGDHADLKTAVLLSPGLDYHGILTVPAARALRPDQRVLLISSRDDDGNAAEVESLAKEIPVASEGKIKIYETGGHGTDLLVSQKELSSIVINFINMDK